MLRWLVAGIGDITTRRVLPAILAEPRSELAGIVTRDPAKAIPYNVPSWTDLDSALAECHADAVYVATPVFLHAPQTIASLNCGKHVLCEKPMAMNYPEAESMVKTAERSQLTLGVAYYRRMYPKIQRLRTLIADGAIGRPVFAEATSHGWFEPKDGSRAWLTKRTQAGGGPLYDIASHRIDLFNYLFGRPARVIAQTSNVVHAYEVEDNATVLIEYDSGVRAMVDVRWHSQVDRDEFKVRGTKGEIDLNPLNGPIIQFPDGREELPPHLNLSYPCIEDFVSAIPEHRQPAASGASSLYTDWVTAEAVRSAFSVS